MSSSSRAATVIGLTVEVGDSVTKFDFSQHQQCEHSTAHQKINTLSDVVDHEDAIIHVNNPNSYHSIDQDVSLNSSHNDDAISSNVTATGSCNSVSPALQFAGVEEQGHISSNVYLSPNSIKFWKPNVQPEYIPSVGSIFDTWEDACAMYEAYAELAGFSTRIGTAKLKNGAYTHRYILCSRAGKPNFRQFDSTKPASKPKTRRSSFKVTDCKACIKLWGVPGTKKYQLYTFVEAHNHGLLDKDNTDLTRKRRKLGFSDQHFIYKMSLNNIGPNVAHKLQSLIKGGHHQVRGTKTDYKNFSRDIRLFIGDRDAQLVINTLTSRMTNRYNFFFEHVVSGNELRSFFWADDVSRCNYESFGDVLAFVATYQTNRYNMILVLFTGVDHHKKCVTFGVGLLYDEKIESYEWLLSTFLKAHNKQPRLVLTDQDASMKQAISVVFYESVHRLCMWHVMKKLPVKISGDLLENTNLRSSIHKLVWNLFITPSMFEEKWHDLMDEYNLLDHPWLSDMYSIREQWVPCYFRDISMCCLMKTTSRCERSNSAFKVNSSSSNTLVQFLHCFDTAIDAQRYMQRKLEFESDTTTPLMLTVLPIESHASDLYTRTIFLEVQKEIQKGFLYCFIIGSEVVDNVKKYTVAHANKQSVVVNEYKVDLDLRDKTVSCSCMGFTRIGYLCRHVFCVFRFNQIDIIPPLYRPDRWRRNALPKRVYDIANRYCVDNSEESKLRNAILDLVVDCVDRLRRKPDRLAELYAQMQDLKKRGFEEFPQDPDYNKKSSVISDLTGQPEHVDVTINPPQGIRNKGCGTNRRLIGPGEKAVDKSKKQPRLCNKCNKYVVGHDSRNCEKVRAAKERSSDVANAADTRDHVRAHQVVPPVRRSSRLTAGRSAHEVDADLSSDPFVDL